MITSYPQLSFILELVGLNARWRPPHLSAKRPQKDEEILNRHTSPNSTIEDRHVGSRPSRQLQTNALRESAAHETKHVVGLVANIKHDIVRLVNAHTPNFLLQPRYARVTSYLPVVLHGRLGTRRILRILGHPHARRPFREVPSKAKQNGNESRNTRAIE